MLKLYYAPATCALAAHIALEDIGAPFEAVAVDFASAEQTKPAYKAINPKARVPALVGDRGTLTEVPAILAYLAQTNPQANLAPLNNPFEFARMQAFNSYLCSTVHVAHAHKGRGTRWVDDPAAIEAMKKKVTQNMAACFELIEQHLFTAPWVLGAAYSVADPYLFTLTRWLEGDGVEVKQFPGVAAHFGRMFERPAVKRALHAQGLPGG